LFHLVGSSALLYLIDDTLSNKNKVKYSQSIHTGYTLILIY